MDDKETIVTPDEAKAEEEALAEAKEDEVRAKIVTDLGLSDDDSKELIDKLVEREIDHRKKLSGAIRQKIDWRNKAGEADPAEPPQPEEKETQTEEKSFDPEEIRKQTETTVKQQLERRDLDEMEHPDEIKADIKKLADLREISVRQAEKDPYIQHKIAEATAAGRADEATIAHAPKSTKATPDTTPDFDLSTEEGRKEYEEWKQSRKRE